MHNVYIVLCVYAYELLFCAFVIVFCYAVTGSCYSRQPDSTYAKLTTRMCQTFDGWNDWWIWQIDFQNDNWLWNIKISFIFFFKKRKLMTVFYSLQQTFEKHLRCSKNIKNEQISDTIYAYSYTTWAFKIILTVRKKLYLFYILNKKINYFLEEQLKIRMSSF